MDAPFTKEMPLLQRRYWPANSKYDMAELNTSYCKVPWQIQWSKSILIQSVEIHIAINHF